MKVRLGKVPPWTHRGRAMGFWWHEVRLAKVFHHNSGGQERRESVNSHQEVDSTGDNYSF